MAFLNWPVSLSIMSSRFIYVVEYVRIPFLRLNNISMYVYNTFLYPLIISIFRNCKTFYSWNKYF